jgi:hypothetical protein
MKSTRTSTLAQFTACIVLCLGLSASAFAGCGDSMSAMAAAATAPRIQTNATALAESSSSANAVDPSIVGLWHIRFVVGDQTIQEAFQLWNAGGTEVHNPKVDPRGGTVCLGVWKTVTGRTYKLAHRVWSYDINGNFLGTIRLTETITLGDNGNTQSGAFTLDFYDPSGNFMFEVPGNVVGERISVE